MPKLLILKQLEKFPLSLLLSLVSFDFTVKPIFHSVFALRPQIQKSIIKLPWSEDSSIKSLFGDVIEVWIMFIEAWK